MASAPGDIDEGREVQWTKRDKVLYAQHDAGVKDSESAGYLTLLTETVSYHLYHIVCAAVHFSGTFVSGTNFYVPDKGDQLVL